VLEDGVEDQPENETRFVWLAHDGGDHPDGRPMKTSVAFWGLADSPGALVSVLQEFAQRDVNLSKIESRPRKQGLGRYVFFADLEGAETDPPIADALASVARAVETLRVLGCYPAAAESATE
jgi:prephenate dehydratase